MGFIFKLKKNKKWEEKEVDSGKKGVSDGDSQENLAPPQEVPELAMQMYPMDVSQNVDLEDTTAVEESIEPDEDKVPIAQEQAKKLDLENLKITKSYVKEESRDAEAKPNPAIIKKQEKAAFEPEPIKQETAANQPKNVQVMGKEDPEHPSFFKDIKDKLLGKKGKHEELILDIAMDKMKNYHQKIDLKQDELAKKAKLDSDLADTIMELELLEQGWYFLRKEIETKNVMLDNKEELIDIKLKELKQLMKESKDMQKTGEKKDKEFTLSNGEVINSLPGLKKALEEMSGEVFSSHVSDNKNDFSNWIRHVFNDQKLADALFLAKTNQEMTKLLEEK